MDSDPKKQAIALRQAAVPVREVAARTGLSVPTVVALHKTFLSGGMAAVAARKPGRPAKQIGPDACASAESIALAGLKPEAAIGGLATSTPALWSMPLLANWLSRQRQKSVDARAAIRAWRQWGWEPEWTSPQAAGTWLACVHGPLPGGLWLLCCRSPRHSAYWLCLDHQPLASDYLDWFERMLKLQPDGMVLQSPLPDLNFIAGLRDWLQQHPKLHLLNNKPLHPAFQKDIVNRPTETSHPTTTMAVGMANSTTSSMQTRLSHLKRLEAESIHIMREVVASCSNPVMLYSIGKDSACMLHLAMKAFAPGRLPFALMHVDTGWKFREMYAFRDRMQAEHGFELRIHQNAEGLAQGINPFTHGSQIHTDIMKTQALRQALDMHGFDAAFGGARRDEEKSRAKERVFSFRSRNHQWDPKNQRPELWNLYNTHIHQGESLRVFPLSNWTELDIWLYIHQEGVPVVPLYFAKERPVVERHGTLIMVDDERMPLHPGEVPVMRRVRFRTLGCYPLTGAIESDAQTVPDIIREMLTSRSSERQGRLIDHDGAASMEKKKQEGYF
jgi:sulfate adenylyltransferase subunit 2